MEQKSFRYLGLLICLALITPLKAQWNKVYLNETSDLFDIHFTSFGHGYIAGQNSTLYKTRDSGTSWQKLSIGGFNNLRAVYFLDTMTGFTFGENAIIRKTTDGAKTWSNKLFFTGSFLVRATFASYRQGIAVGQRGLIVSTADSGNTWKLDTVPYKRNFNAVAVTPNGTCWAVGDSGAIFHKPITRGKWIKASYPTKIKLNDIKVFNDSVFIVSGGMADTTNVGKFFNILLYTNNAGKSWQNTTIAEAKQINAAYFVNPDTGYLAGTGGLVIKTYQHGQTNGRQVTASSNSISDITFVTPAKGFCIGDGGLLMRTYNAGGYGTGIATTLNPLIRTYPNPVMMGEPMFIDHCNPEKVMVTDIYGKTENVLVSVLSPERLSVQFPCQGIYHLIILEKNHKTIIKVLVQ